MLFTDRNRRLQGRSCRFETLEAAGAEGWLLPSYRSVSAQELDVYAQRFDVPESLTTVTNELYTTRASTAPPDARAK